MTLITTKTNRCKHCKQRMPADKARHVIHNDCIEPWLVIQNAKKAAKLKREVLAKAKVERASDRQRKEATKTRSDHLREAKTAVQQSRRLEELAKGRGCMSCQRTQAEVMGTDAWKPGGAWDGGHFLSKGARPELALEPLNIWLQCKSCNAGSSKYARKGYTVNANFEANLIATEGQALVDWLKGPHDLNHYTVDELKQIKATHNAKSSALKKAMKC